MTPPWLARACRLATLLLAGAGAAGAWGAVVVPVEIDMRAEIAAQRFDPARDGVGVRGGMAPLSWAATLPARPLGDGRYGAEIRFEREYECHESYVLSMKSTSTALTPAKISNGAFSML